MKKVRCWLQIDDAAKPIYGIVWILLGKIDCQGPGAGSFRRIKTAPHLVSGNLLDVASD